MAPPDAAPEEHPQTPRLLPPRRANERLCSVSQSNGCSGYALGDEPQTSPRAADEQTAGVGSANVT
jgi:hypothetical protein